MTGHCRRVARSIRDRHHRSTGRLLDAWVDGELDPAHGGSRAGRHVAECWDCSAATETTRPTQRRTSRGAARRRAEPVAGDGSVAMLPSGRGFRPPTPRPVVARH